jgi:hypothetical protein
LIAKKNAKKSDGNIQIVLVRFIPTSILGLWEFTSNHENLIVLTKIWVVMNMGVIANIIIKIFLGDQFFIKIISSI